MQNSNNVAFACQMHSKNHNATCFKYSAAKTQKCRFNFPCPIVDHTKISDIGGIEICQNNLWVNSWNNAFVSLIQSNHDVTFIPSTVKALVLIRYITNYATKSNCDQYQRALAFFMARKALEKISHKAIEEGHFLTAAPHALNKLDSKNKFALQAFNRIAHNQKTSGPLAANTLLQLPEYYTPKGMMLKRISTDSIRK